MDPPPSSPPIDRSCFHEASYRRGIQSCTSLFGSKQQCSARHHASRIASAAYLDTQSNQLFTLSARPASNSKAILTRQSRLDSLERDLPPGQIRACHKIGQFEKSLSSLCLDVACQSAQSLSILGRRQTAFSASTMNDPAARKPLPRFAARMSIPTAP